MLQLENVVSDRGSKYAVSGAGAASRDEVEALLKALRSVKKYARASHNSWAILLADGTPLKGDDGEAGAGMVILRMLEGEGWRDHLIAASPEFDQGQRRLIRRWIRVGAITLMAGGPVATTRRHPAAFLARPAHGAGRRAESGQVEGARRSRSGALGRDGATLPKLWVDAGL